MKFQRIQFPAKTLIVSSLEAPYHTFILYFLKLWTDKFREQPDVTADSVMMKGLAYPVRPPAKFFPCLMFLLRGYYRTLVFLNPDPKADRPLKWAARLLFVKRRAGFAPLKGFHTFNYSLPFNTENHHYVHQLKIFFEYLTGEKVADWRKPELAASDFSASVIALPPENYGVIAIDAHHPLTPLVLTQLGKFINIAARNLHLVLTIGGNNAPGSDDAASPQELSRALSDMMTERAVKQTLLIINPTEAEKIAHLHEAVWATGTDTETLNLAALLAIPGLSIFGPLNERVWQPFATRARVLAGDFACRPCTKLPGKVTCTNPVAWQCVSGVTGELIAATLTGMLQRKVRPGSAAAS